jgi:hypothetical protein
MRINAAQIASSRIQNAKGARASVVDTRKSVAAETATAQITIAVIASITADNPSARNATPSGGDQAPSR